MPSKKCFPPRRVSALDDLAKQYKIIPYQQERIKIDGMYKLPENKKIVDEYKDILITVSEKGQVNPSELAKLSRLRTLSLRLNIPHTLFDTLDELLLKDMQIVEVEEPEYVKDTRAIFEGLFFRTDKIRGHLSPGGPRETPEGQAEIHRGQGPGLRGTSARYGQGLRRACAGHQ